MVFELRRAREEFTRCKKRNHFENWALDWGDRLLCALEGMDDEEFEDPDVAENAAPELPLDLKKH